VTVFEGRVTLTGHVLADEVDRLLRQVGRVRGVSEVKNELEIHRTSNGIPALQGSTLSSEQRPELLQENWAPATRLVVGSVGGLLALQSTRSSGLPGRLLGVVGLGLLARATSNMPPDRLVGIVRGRPTFQVEKTIKVSAPVDRVWELWSNFENFPRFMAHLREVQKVDEGRSHWVAAGPAGIPVEWDAVVTDWVPNQFIGWTTTEGSPVEMTGQVRLRPTSENETEIDVQLAYNPPAGAAGHAVASILGADPKRAMDEDLVRLKSLLENEKTSKAGDTVRLEEVVATSKSGRSRKGTTRDKS
jgi:uncharacterized membrane protein